ncbi:MAG TPA: hypothetical protein VGG19_18680 [Tepidisphaeraceae bacterium]|jgi:hypothetical protein
MAGNDPLNPFKWLLGLDIRWKNALSLLIGIVSVGVVCFEARNTEWFHELGNKGNSAVTAFLAGLLVAVFLMVWLILSAAVALDTRRHLSIQREQAKHQELKQIEATLSSLTNWQRSFLLRYIVGDTMQINEWEVGEYKAIWGPEVDVLIAKGIVRKHLGGVLEIVPVYAQFLRAFWNPATQKLERI